MSYLRHALHAMARRFLPWAYLRDPAYDRDLFDVFTRLDIDDFLKGFGLTNSRWGRRLVEVICYPSARSFAAKVLEYDRRVGADGMASAHWWMLNQIGRGLDVHGFANVPRTGPLLILSNHPGLNDSSALLASIPRQDIRIIGIQREFLRCLPNTSRYLLMLESNPRERIGLIRATTRHLRAGGCLLVYPAGHIEPDPAVFSGASESLEEWSISVDLWARHVPGLQIVPTLVSHVLTPEAQRSPLVYVRRTEDDRRWLAAMLQLAFPAYQTNIVQLRFGTPIVPTQTALPLGDTPYRAVQREMRRLIGEVEATVTHLDA